MLRFERVELWLPDGFGTLRAEADAEDIGNVSRLEFDWLNRSERFLKTGELLLACFEGVRLAAIGGITHEPNADLRALRLRRLYVRPAWRRCGVGSALVMRLTEHGFRFVDLMTLNAGAPGSERFWEAIGFQRAQCDGWTHEMHRAEKSS